jgi:CBS-domain-containing membrane protein
MTRNVIVLEDDMPLSFAISFLNKFRFGRFPVLNKERQLVGIISSKDVIEPPGGDEPRSAAPGAEPSERRRFRAQERRNRAGIPYPRYDFEGAGRASTDIKKALKQ